MYITRSFLFAGVLAALLLGCGGSKQNKSTTPGNQQTLKASQDEKPASPQQDPNQSVSAQAVKPDGSVVSFDPIYFDYDSTVLTDTARSQLSVMGEYMRANKDVSLVVEGHCDERGTTEYNLALGDRRARAARDYLVRLGIENKRIDVVSYGKERPAVEGDDELAWSKNRRGEFKRK